MTFTYSIPGESETLETEDVWILAPNIGKLKIAVMDQFMIQRGWLTITGGTVGGKAVADIINPTVADFVANPVDGIAPVAVSFTDKSTGTITSRNWNFGDGTSSAVKNPTHTYTDAGTYSVSHTVSGPYGSDAKTKADYISVKSAQKATIVTEAATAVSTGSAILNGTINPNGSDTSYYFQYGTTAVYGQQTATVPAGSGVAAVPVSASIGGLAVGTVHHFRLAGVNTAGTAYGADQTFTTSALPPTVTTLAASAIGHDSAASGGNVTSDGGAAVTAKGVCWAEAENPTVADSKTVDGVGIGGFSSLISGLTPGTAYHVRAYATNSAGTAYGDNCAFATASFAPTVATGPATMDEGTSAVLHATVNPNGDISEWYFEYGVTIDYDLATPLEDAGDGTAAVAVSAAVADLLSDSAYHYRIVAANSVGTSHGADRAFSTQILYVAPNGDCGGKTPCYTLIQSAVADAGDLATICIASGEYAENLDLGVAKALNFSGGWDDHFSAVAGFTIIDGGPLPPLAVKRGTLAVKNLALK